MLVMKQILGLLSRSEKRRGCLLLLLIFLMAMIDAIGVASIMPFIALLFNPDLIKSNLLLNKAYLIGNFESEDTFLFFSGVSVFSLIILSLSVRAVTAYAQLRYTLMREYSLGKKLVKRYLSQPYSWFLEQHSADLAKRAISEVETVVRFGITPFVNLVAHGTVAVFLILLLVAVNWFVALFSGAIIIFFYVMTYLFTRKILSRLGDSRLAANRKRFKILSDAFGGVKEVKTSGLERRYLDGFSQPAKIYAGNQAAAQSIGQIPRFVLEGVAFGGMLALILFLMAGLGDISKALPTVSLFALAGYRLLPALQQVYSAFTQLKFVGGAVNALYADLSQLSPGTTAQASQRVNFDSNLRLDEIDYSYQGSESFSIKGLNMEIEKGNFVAVVGRTGGGKTTAIDLLVGLLRPQRGALVVDGVKITQSNLRDWQRKIGYVVQQPYLFDASIRANIALGCAEEDVDEDRLMVAARVADLEQFITGKLPNGFDTQVGERGVRLSGGQRQRLGIARAIYKRPSVLVLDEATSALDSVTQRRVIERIRNLDEQMTVVMVVHRISLTRFCDKIFIIEGGTITGAGTYDELSCISEEFKHMLGKS